MAMVSVSNDGCPFCFWHINLQKQAGTICFVNIPSMSGKLYACLCDGTKIYSKLLRIDNSATKSNLVSDMQIKTKYIS